MQVLFYSMIQDSAITTQDTTTETPFDVPLHASLCTCVSMLFQYVRWIYLLILFTFFIIFSFNILLEDHLQSWKICKTHNFPKTAGTWNPIRLRHGSPSAETWPSFHDWRAVRNTPDTPSNSVGCWVRFSHRWTFAIMKNDGQISYT